MRDGQHVGGGGAARQQVGSAVLLPPGMGEQVPGLHRLRAGVVAEEGRLEPADHAPVQELVIHVEQVLVHERVVAADRAGERHRLVPRRAELGQLGQRRARRRPRVAREDEDQAVGLADGVGTDTARWPAGALGQVGNLRDAAVPAVGPGVVAAAERVAFHHAHAQRYLPVRAPVFQRVDRAARSPVQSDALAGESGGEGRFLPYLSRYGHRVPEVRIDPYPPQVGNGAGGLVKRSIVIGCERLRHAVLPVCGDPGPVGGGNARQSPPYRMKA